MPRYRVTLRRTSVEIVEAENPYQAAIVAADRYGDGVEIETVAPAVGRPAGGTNATSKAVGAKPVKNAVKKRRPMSAETRAKMAKNLIKARAVRARNLKAAKKTTKSAMAK
jgi:hypothetical protein